MYSSFHKDTVRYASVEIDGFDVVLFQIYWTIMCQ